MTSTSSWQHPYVNIFKYFDINSAKRCLKQGDVTSIMDRDLKSTVYRIRGLVPANNYIQFPSNTSTQNLSLTGRLFYVLFRPIFDKYFCIHIDILTQEQHTIRISLSNLYREFKVTQTSIQFPYMTTGTDIHWSVLCLDLHTILLTYMTNEHFHLLKSFQLCGNMFVKNCFTSQFLYEPGIDNDTAKRTGLTHAGILSLPRELSYPIGKGESWHDKYDFIMFPNTSTLAGKNQNEPFDKVGNVRLPTPRKLKSNDETLDEDDDLFEILPLTAQTTLINGQVSRSITDFSQITKRSVSPGENQLNWRTYDNPNNNFSSLPTFNDSSLVTQRTDDGIHLFVNPQSIPSATKITDEFDYNLALNIDRSHPSHLTTLLPDPILRLQTIIGFTNRFNNLLWTQDGNYVLYPANAIVVQMHIETQQQWFFIGHTDKVKAIAFNNNLGLLVSIQTGVHAIIRLWKFETRRCLCATRVSNIQNLHSLDFAVEKSSSSIVLVGQDEHSRTVVCVYNTSNVLKGSIEFLSRATTDVLITHIRFVPGDITRFLSIGTDNIQFWRIKSDNDLQSINLAENDFRQVEYTDFQFDYSSKKKSSELAIYLTTKTGQILEILYDERRLIRVHNLADKIKPIQDSALAISTLTCTKHFSIIGTDDGYVRVWSNDFSQVHIEAKYEQTIMKLISSYDQTRILILTASGSLNLLNLVTKQHRNLFRSHMKSITDVDYDDSKKQMISVGQDGTIRLWCFRTGKQLAEFISEKETPLVVTYTPSREIFACGFHNGTIKIFDLKTSRILNETKHHQGSINGLVYSSNGFYLISSDENGDLCLSDAENKYKSLKILQNVLVRNENSSLALSTSSDRKYIVYIGPTEYLVTIIETNTLNQTLRIDISSCTYVTDEQQTVTSAEAALFARFTPSRFLLVATKTFRLLKFDSYSGKLLNIIDDIYKHSFDSLTLSSNSQYMVTSGDKILKFWNANMDLDVNSQDFLGHSEGARKVFFTDDNMHMISVGDSILIWNVLAWNKEQPVTTKFENAQCIVPPEAVKTKILENTSAKGTVKSIEYSQELNENIDIDDTLYEEKKTIHKKLLTKQYHADYSPSSSRRQFIPRVNHSQLAKKRYMPPTNQESLKLQLIIGYNGNGRDNLVWHPYTGFFAYTIGCNIIVENLNSSQQTILSGHTEEISTMTLSTDATSLASAQCSTGMKKDECQSKIIIWDTKTLRQKCHFYQSVFAIQTMAYSKDDRFFITIGNFRKPILTIWSTNNYFQLLNWQNELSSSHINCLAWNPLRSNEFSIGSSHNFLHFFTINEQTDNSNIRLQVIQGELPVLLNEHKKSSSDITTCAYLTSTSNLVLCATNYGYVTCWNSRLALCVLHWKADINEITYLSTIDHKLITGSSIGYLKLWNLEDSGINSIESKSGVTMEDEFQLDNGIISGSFDNTFDMGIVGTLSGSLWYICWRTDRSKTRLLASHTDDITGLITIEDTHIVTSSLDGTIRIFQIDDRNETLRFNANGLKVTCLTSWENQSIVAGYIDGTIRIFHLVHGEMILKIHPHTSSVTTIHIPSKTNICLSGASDGIVAITNLVQGCLLRLINEHSGTIPICMIDSKRINEKNLFYWLITSHDRRVSLWKSNDIEFRFCSLIDWLIFSSTDSKIDWQLNPPSLASFLDDKSILYSGYGLDKTFQIYNIHTKEILRKLSLNHWCYSFDIVNDLIAFGTNERIIQLKDYTQETFQDFSGHIDRILNVKFNRSRDLLITTSANEVFVWKLGFN